MGPEVGGVLVLAGCAAGSGALVHAVTRAAASGSLALNHLVGIRTRRTTASADAWTAGHGGALPWTRRTAGATVVLGLGSIAMLPAGPAAAYAVALGANLALVAGCLLGTRAAHRAIAQASSVATSTS